MNEWKLQAAYNLVEVFLKSKAFHQPQYPALLVQ
jgi:hypothetical protein